MVDPIREKFEAEFGEESSQFVHSREWYEWHAHLRIYRAGHAQGQTDALAAMLTSKRLEAMERDDDGG